MRLVRLGPAGEERPAVLLDDERAFDVSHHVDDFGPDFFGSGGLDLLRGIVEAEGGGAAAGGIAGERLGSPIARPHKVIGIGLNYEDHAREAGMDIPTEPVVFMKATSALSGPYDDLVLPPRAEKVDWEVELGVVVGDTARYLTDEDAASRAIAGYCVAHDVSERAFQLELGGQWVKGKSAETFCPVGPRMVTVDEISDVRDLELSLRVNDEVMQEGNTKTMIFGPAHLVWYLSQFMVLEPGDLILTGTPPGIGMARGRYLQEGDVVELSITGLGTQRQTCRRVRHGG